MSVVFDLLKKYKNTTINILKNGANTYVIIFIYVLLFVSVSYNFCRIRSHGDTSQRT